MPRSSQNPLTLRKTPQSVRGKKDNPEIYTQTIESLWSQYKRNLMGTYRGAGSVKYLENYNNEYLWEYNQRNKEDKFDMLLTQAITPTLGD